MPTWWPGRARSVTSNASGIEGTGSYGVGLASFVRRQGLRVVEVNQCDRRKRRNDGKNDTLDAEAAARAVLAGVATAVPKAADGMAEMAHQIKIARDTAVKVRSTAMVTLKTLLVNAPGRVREAIEPLTDQKLIDRCAALRTGNILDPTGSVKHALRALARRWRTLSAEIDEHDELLDIITRAAVPTLREAFGIGPDAAAEMMSVAGDNPTPIRSEAAFAKLCGACPIPASSGVTNRHQSASALPRRPPPCQRDSLADRDRPHALAPGDHRLRPPTHRRGLVEEGHHPLPEALRRSRDLPRTDRRPQSRCGACAEAA